MDKGGERIRNIVKVWYMLLSGERILSIASLVTKFGFWKIQKFIQGCRLILCHSHLQFLITGIKNYTQTLAKLLLIHFPI